MYCMQCGTPAFEAAPIQATTTKGLAEPSVIGGIVLGILSSLPLINLGNCMCCMWVLGGGALASYLMIRQSPDGPSSVTYGDGAFVGVMSGVVGAIIATAFSLPFRLLASDALRTQQEAFKEMMNAYPTLEGPMRELLLRLVSPEISFVMLMTTLFVNLLVFSLFAMIGGILMVSILKKDKNETSAAGE